MAGSGRPPIGVWRPLLLLAILLPACEEELAGDEDVTLFPTAAHLSEDGERWIVPIHAWVYEPEKGSLVRAATTSLVRKALGVPEDTPEARLLAARLRWFLVDNERGKRPRVQVGGLELALPRTGADGHTIGHVELDRAQADAAARDGWLELRVVAAEGDGRGFTGAVRLVAPEGVSVVSDIDDTVRIAGVADRKRLARATLSEPLVPVDGMAAVYTEWMERPGAAMHWLTAAPWQLVPVFSEFLDAGGFPRGTFHCKRVRFAGRDVFKLFEDAAVTKRAALTGLFATFPRRRFVLVGDTGEKDPEVYADFARAWPERVLAVWLRDVTGETRESPRLKALFEGVPAERWAVFTAAAQLRWPVRWPE